MSEAIRIAIDFKSPEAYLAIAPTRELETRRGLALDWLPLSTAVLTRAAPPAASEDRAARHRRFRAEYVADDLRRYAAARGLELGDLYRESDTTAAALGLLWLRRQAPELASAYVARVFDRVWRENAAADLDFVEQSLVAARSGFRAYAAAAGAEEIESLRLELAQAGAWSTPAYLVAGDVFIGRQHLPMVEWLAGGRTGPPPI